MSERMGGWRVLRKRERERLQPQGVSLDQMSLSLGLVLVCEQPLPAAPTCHLTQYRGKKKQDKKRPECTYNRQLPALPQGRAELPNKLNPGRKK